MSPREGQHQSIDARRAISESLAGRELTEAQKEKISKGKIEAFKKREAGHKYELPKTKICSKCGKRKSADQFLIKKKTLKSGVKREYLAGECRKCAGERAAKWREDRRWEDQMGKINRRYDENRSQESKDKRNETLRMKRQEESQKAGRKPIRRKKTVVKRSADLVKVGQEVLDVEPISEWLIENGVTAVPGVADAAVISVRNRLGTYKDKISLDLVDRILTGMEEPWVSFDLYPLPE